MSNMFNIKSLKEPIVEHIMKGLFTSTLSNKDTSFSIIAIRCNSEGSTGKRKMSNGVIYQFIQGYEIDNTSVKVHSYRPRQNTLYDDFYEEIGLPHIQISAIVGQNGSGKSSIVEFFMRLINNFAAATIGEMQGYGQATEHLHFVDGVDGDLWYILKGDAYRLNVKNCSVVLYKYRKKEEKTNEIHYTEEQPIFSNNKNSICKNLLEVHTALGDDDLKELYRNFFYTLISNQSIYAYNTLDFEDECNSDEKERQIAGKSVNETFEVENRCWLHGLFHKNDAYRTPLVITPYRHKGNMDINNERELAIERLVRLYALHEDLRTINDHLLAESITYSYDFRQDYGIKRVKTRLQYKNLTQGGYEKLKAQISKEWENVVKIDFTKCQQKRYYNEAIEYLVYKTLKVSYQYKEHRDFYDATSMMDDAYNEDTLHEYIITLSKDHSHITRKIFQTLAFLKFNVFDINRESINPQAEETIDFSVLGKKWFEMTKTSSNDMVSDILVHLRMQAIVPPPFMKMKINLCEKSDSNKKINFETLSSGEKQQIFTISSILYHLDNINSAHVDKSSTQRIKYGNVCIVLEEIELYYHPQLQQQFIHYFLDGIKDVNLEHIKSIHLIIVTHSPYVLSDIPRTNVLALKKEDTEPISDLRSFGANVYDMLKDSFFLENGAMGMFAQWEVAHLMACMKVHQWAIAADDTKEFPFVENEDYAFLNRYLYHNPNDMAQKKFSYDDFCRDFSSESIKERILLIDEPVVFHVLMEEFSRTFPGEQKRLRKEELLRQLEELENQ